MSLLNLFFPFSSFLPHHSIHFSFTHQQIQLNPDSNSLYVHINYSALHAVQMPPTPLTLSVALLLPWQPGVAVLMSETPPRTLMQALGQVICTAAGHRLTPKNKMAAIPLIFFFFFFAAWESHSLRFKQKRKCNLCLPDTFLIWWYVWYGWCGIFSVWLVWPKRITELSCLSPSEISCLSKEFRNLSAHLSAFTCVCAFVFECVRTLVSSGWH